MRRASASCAYTSTTRVVRHRGLTTASGIAQRQNLPKAKKKKYRGKKTIMTTKRFTAHSAVPEGYRGPAVQQRCSRLTRSAGNERRVVSARSVGLFRDPARDHGPMNAASRVAMPCRLQRSEDELRHKNARTVRWHLAPRRAHCHQSVVARQQTSRKSPARENEQTDVLPRRDSRQVIDCSRA
jgi:hypothetical protein